MYPSAHTRSEDDGLFPRFFIGLPPTAYGRRKRSSALGRSQPKVVFVYHSGIFWGAIVAWYHPKRAHGARSVPILCTDLHTSMLLFFAEIGSTAHKRAQGARWYFPPLPLC